MSTLKNPQTKQVRLPEHDDSSTLPRFGS
jgi:hypothetical protein